jgi:hypothetical protein
VTAIPHTHDATVLRIGEFRKCRTLAEVHSDRAYCNRLARKPVKNSEGGLAAALAFELL